MPFVLLKKEVHTLTNHYENFLYPRKHHKNYAAGLIDVGFCATMLYKYNFIDNGGKYSSKF